MKSGSSSAMLFTVRTNDGTGRRYKSTSAEPHMSSRVAREDMKREAHAGVFNQRAAGYKPITRRRSDACKIAISNTETEKAVIKSFTSFTNMTSKYIAS